VQAVVFQSLYGDIIAHKFEAKEEVSIDYYDQLQRLISKRYTIFSDYKVIKAYMIDDYTFVVQLYNAKSKLYAVVEL